IHWTAHLANRKAAWYRFGRAMDIPEATRESRRNGGVARDRLVLDAGQRTVTQGGHIELHATAMGVTLLLGEVLCHPSGRLIVLAGHGKARSWTGAPVSTFANNDEWLDEIADGPIGARVKIGNRTFQATPAWVLTSPPNYAPGLPTGWKTMYDL